MQPLPSRQRRRLAIAAGTIALSCLSVLTVAAPASAASPARYVALGDSYSSGLGAGHYLSSGGSCDRSASAYSQLWDNASWPVSYLSVACAGATTGSVISGQLAALSTATTLVSITIGGNDVGFSAVMETCVLAGTRTCVQAIGAAESAMSSKLPGKLDGVLSAIAAAAPHARIVVLDYPQLYDLAKSKGCIGLSTTDRSDLNAAATDLDRQIRAAAARHRDVFADVRRAFAGHHICDPGSWLHSVSLLDLPESYHPTAAGQAGGYLPVLSRAA